MLLTASMRRRDAAVPADRGGFRSWSRRRPLIGGILTVLAGAEMFLSSQLDIGHLHVQLGIEGFQATVIPLVLILLALSINLFGDWLRDALNPKLR